MYLLPKPSSHLLGGVLASLSLSLSLVIFHFPASVSASPVSPKPIPMATPKHLRDIHARLEVPLSYPTDLCSTNTTTTTPTKIPHLWSVSVQNITYSIPGIYDVPGTATFTVTNTFTNVTEKIACGLRFDSLCDVSLSTTNTKTQSVGGGGGVLDVSFQALIEVAYVTVVESVSCEGKNGSVSMSVGGMAEVYLGCDFEGSPRRCWGEEGGWVDAEVLGEVPGGGTGGR
ncbi:hypothetical protein B0T09DRAFT_312882 [Sordaria sp. MPI-SDFR-AT-0083]|nr:hypothetical protein B0T09DRAFT_312882 [Sordaria sp. MPI-SDFR-AT-0083]